jgi:ATP-grasp domain
MGVPTLILGKGTDRRVFDLYNILSRDYTIIIWGAGVSIKDHLLYPRAKKLGVRNLTAVIAYVEEYSTTEFIWIPLVESELEALLHLEHIPPNLKYLLPPIENFKLATNKLYFTQRFESLHLTPPSFTIEELKNNFPLAGVVVKPAIGKGSVGRKFIKKFDELGQIDEKDVIQLCIGKGIAVIGAFFLAYQGDIIRHYQHQRTRTFPSNGGVSTCAETVFYNEVYDSGKKIIEALNWSGLCMIEFLQDPSTNRYYAIECNTRIWGSVMLDEFSNNHLIRGYIDLCSGKVLAPVVPKDYAVIRWLFPYELLNAMLRPLKNWKLSSWINNYTCYIGFSYSSISRSIFFSLANVLSPSKWILFFKKKIG